jgi:hypothetical protein
MQRKTAGSRVIFQSAPLRCALAYGSKEWFSFVLVPGTYSSSRLRPDSETWPGYYQPSLAGLGIVGLKLL